MSDEEYDPWESNPYGIPVYWEEPIFPAAAPIIRKKFAVQVAVTDAVLRRAHSRFEAGILEIGRELARQMLDEAIGELLNGQTHG